MQIQDLKPNRLLTPIEIRRLMHQFPELSEVEYKSTELISQQVQILENFFPQAHLTIHRPLQTGLIVEYQGDKSSNSYVIYRGDLDALPIQEESCSPYPSKVTGVMHACGHDIHTSILFGFLQEVLKKSIKRNILFVFQPAEESGGGAQAMLDSGFFSSYQISQAYALHVSDEFAQGEVASCPGVLFASALAFDVTFEGRSSHLAFPHKGLNAFNALRSFVDELEKIPPVPDQPVLYGLGHIKVGETRNIVPAKAIVEGSVRSFSEQGTLNFLEKIKKILAGIELSTGIKGSVKVVSHYQPVINDQPLFEASSKRLSQSHQFVRCCSKYTGEDFGFFTLKYPSFMFWLGTRQKELDVVGLHSPSFFPSEEVIDQGIKAFGSLLEI